MKNIQQITSEHINNLRKGQFTLDINEIEKNGAAVALRIKNRIENDPSVMDLADFFKNAVLFTATLPEPFKDQMVRNTIVNCLLEWEEINLEFEAQLKAND